MANINISTVGNGGTYTNLDSWWYYILQGNGDLVTRDVVEIAEIQPGTYVSSGTILRMEPISGVNTDPNRFFVIRADSNNRFNGDTTYTPVRFNIFPTGTMAAFYSDVPYTRFEHLVVAQTGFYTSANNRQATVGFDVTNGIVDSCGVLDIKSTVGAASGSYSEVIGISVGENTTVRNNVITGLSSEVQEAGIGTTTSKTVGINQLFLTGNVYNNSVYNLDSSCYPQGVGTNSYCYGYKLFGNYPVVGGLDPVLWLDTFGRDNYIYAPIQDPSPLPLISWWLDKSIYNNHASGNTNNVLYLFAATNSGVDLNGYATFGPHQRKMQIQPGHELTGLENGFTTFMLGMAADMEPAGAYNGKHWFTTYESGNNYTLFVGKNADNTLAHKINNPNSGIMLHYYTGIYPDNTWFLMSATYDPNEPGRDGSGVIRTYLNKTQSAIGYYASNHYQHIIDQTYDGYTLGGLWDINTGWVGGASNNCNVVLGAVVVYNRPLDTEYRELIEDYLIGHIDGFPDISLTHAGTIETKNNMIAESHNANGLRRASGDYYWMTYSGKNNASQDNTAGGIRDFLGYDQTSITGVNPNTVFKTISPFDSHILDTAPIKNSGVRLNSFIWDIDGQVRGDLWDMGADEAGSGIDSQGINEVAMSLHSDYGISDNSLTLFAQSQQESYGDIPFYTYGGVGTNDTLPLFVGNYYVEDGLPLVIGGENTDTSMILFVKVFGETLDKSMPLYTFSDTSEGGPPPGSGIRSLTLVVGNSITGEEITSMNLFIKGGGPLPDNASIPLYVETKGTGSGMPLYVHSWAAGIGENTATLLIPGSVWNPVFFTDPIPLTISGRIQVNVPLNLFLKSDTPTTTAAIPLFIHNSGLNKGLNLYARGYGFGDPYAEGLQGGQAAYTNMPLFINREFNSLAAWVPMTVWTSEGISSGVVPMYTHGFAGTSGSGMPLSMAPSYAQFNNITQLYTHGF